MDILDKFIERGFELEAIHSPFVTTTCNLRNDFWLHQFLKGRLKTLRLLQRSKLGGYDRDNICKTPHIDCSQWQQCRCGRLQPVPNNGLENNVLKHSSCGSVNDIRMGCQMAAESFALEMLAGKSTESPEGTLGYKGITVAHSK